MKEESVRKRGWVKNVTIIFLAVLVVLTFFSNTIMNRALPEVATQNTTSGTITARIRGSGTVTAIESYEVMMEQTRTVNEVRVRLGDEVEPGDILLVLAGTGSAELDKAREELHELELQLEKKLVESPGVNENVASAARNVQRARNALSDAQRVLNAIHFNEDVFNWAQAEYNRTQAELRRAREFASARAFDLAIAEAELTALGPAPGLPGSTVDQGVYNQALQKQRDAEFANSLAQAAATAAATSASGPEEEFNRQNGSRTEWISASAAVRDAELSLSEANAALTLAQQSDNTASAITEIELRELRRQIDEKRDEVEELERDGTGSEITSKVFGIVSAVNISPGNQTQADTPLVVIEVVDRGYTLNFPVSTEVSTRVRVGDNAEVDRGWWGWGEDVTAILTAIRSNPQDPAMSRLLEFTIHGDIESGTQLNVTLNQRSENYETIVPNSAIRTDANGDFVLVVMSRPSPLGNRFIATRTDVRILATDDTHTAVSGAFSGWGGDFVITHSNEPINPGMQVRLVDNP